ncbi:MAG TPA: AMP-binding protein [Woeseiaceae bacterium]|nr:AMP-binding protein [Woeseiaceae bacterium]
MKQPVATEKIWLQSYPEGVPETVPTPPYRSVRDIFELAFREFPERPAYTNMGTTLTYRDLDELSSAFGACLQKSFGLVKGERIAIMLPNVLQYPVALCGAFRAGLVVVNINPLYTARELEHQLADSGAKCIVILENFAHVLEDIIAGTAIEHVVTTRLGDLLQKPRGWIVNFVLKHVKRMVPPFSLPGRVSLPAALGQGGRQSLTPVELGYADLAFLQYTGGTTGRAKGAMLSHRNLVFNVAQGKAWQENVFGGVERIVVITALPLYHIFSLQSNCLGLAVQGGESVLITNPRDYRAFVRELSRHRYNYLTGVNTLFAGLLDTPGFADLDFSSLRLSIGGGMAVQEAIARRWKRVTGNSIVQAYGLTETSPGAIANPVTAEEFTGSIGLPLPSTEVRICDEAGRDVPPGTAGEICVRGPQVMEGYWKAPEETARVMLPGGWLRTGDIGHMDERGYIYIDDRKKDMILVSGFNVYPNEIESVVAEMAGVREAAAIGIPDERSGEAVKLFVVRSDESLTADDILGYCRKNLTGYKIPRSVEFRDELPKTNVGKILRRALRESQ